MARHEWNSTSSPAKPVPFHPDLPITKPSRQSASTSSSSPSLGLGRGMDPPANEQRAIGRVSASQYASQDSLPKDIIPSKVHTRLVSNKTCWEQTAPTFVLVS